MKLLEYIETSGSQYIMTNYYPNTDTVVNVKFRATNANNYPTLFGVRNSTEKKACTVFTSHRYYQELRYEWDDLGQDFLAGSFTNFYGTDTELEFKNGSLVATNGVDTISQTFNQASYTSTFKLALFNLNHNGSIIGNVCYWTGRLYSFSIKENGVTVLNLCPAKDDNDVVCLYDSVSDSFLYNGGSGSFTPGPELPEGTKYLLESGGNYYTVSGGSLTNIGSTLNAALFTTYGMNDAPDWTDYSSLTNPSVLCWNQDEQIDLTATTTGLPGTQTIISSDLAAYPPDASGISDVSITETGSPKYAFSVDSGTTWKVWSGSAWVASSGVASDMSSATVEAITKSQWDSLITGQTYIKVRFSLFSDTDTVGEIAINYA